MNIQLYPALDLMGGECVRLSQGCFDEKTTYSPDPLAVLDAFRAAGASAIHIVDLDGARNASARQKPLLRRLLANGTLVSQVGGGVRSTADAEELIELGATRVIIGSLAVADPSEMNALVRRLGPSRITLAVDVVLDADGRPWVATHGWQRRSSVTLWELLEGYSEAKFVHLLCTDIHRDGMLGGPNVELYRELGRRYPEMSIQASGGMKELDDFRKLAEAGAAGAIVGRSIYVGQIDLREAIDFCEGKVLC